MCGIAGVFLRSGTRQDRPIDSVRSAVELMKHRGPDDQVAVEVAEVIVWGMCRLAIRDPSPAGRLEGGPLTIPPLAGHLG